MTGWLRVGLKVNHHASPPKARGAAGTMVICGGGQFCPQEGKMGRGGGEAWHVEANPVTHPECQRACQYNRSMVGLNHLRVVMVVITGYSKEARLTTHNSLFDNHNKDGDHSWTYLFSIYSNGGLPHKEVVL